MELYTLITLYAERIIPIFIRIATMLSFIPFIGGRTTPLLARSGIALALTFLLLPVVEVRTGDPVRAVFEAVFVGVAMGLAARIILAAVEMAGQWISLQMGLSIAAVFNPQFGEVLSPLSLFYSLAAMALFFALDLHYYFIEGIVRSFDLTAVRYDGAFATLMKLNALLFPLAFKIAAPIILVQLLVNLGVGFLSRALPQANIFFVSMPLIIVVGLLFIALSMPLMLMVISKGFMHVKDALAALTR